MNFFATIFSLGYFNFLKCHQPIYTVNELLSNDFVFPKSQKEYPGDPKLHKDQFENEAARDEEYQFGDIVKDDLWVNKSREELGRICFDKVMILEETEYEETITCAHNYTKRCHETYVTTFEPHQEQKCDENFKKICNIKFEDIATNKLVKECKTKLIPDCVSNGPVHCKKVYEIECTTQQSVHQVEEDIPNCQTVIEKNCYYVTQG